MTNDAMPSDNEEDRSIINNLHESVANPTREQIIAVVGNERYVVVGNQAVLGTELATGAPQANSQVVDNSTGYESNTGLHHLPADIDTSSSADSIPPSEQLILKDIYDKEKEEENKKGS